jgi:hypothetical protein
MKPFDLLNRSHKPDIVLLSALVDGALDAELARETETHIAGCAACAAELEALKRVKAMLSALPQVEPRRSFRLRQSDNEAPARRAPAPVGPLLRALPALASGAALVFVGALTADLSTRDGDGDRQATSGRTLDTAESAAMDDPTMQLRAGDDAAGPATGDGFAETSATPAAAAAGGMVPDDADVAPPVPGAAELQQTLEREAAAQPDMTQADSARAASAEVGDDEGNRTAFLAVEIAAGIVAVGAAAAFVASRRRRSEGST